MNSLKIEKKELAPGIISFENILENPNQFIVDLETSISLGFLSWGQAFQSGGTKNSKHEIEKSSRDCQVISLTGCDSLDESNKFGPRYEVHSFLNKNILPFLDLYKNDFSAHHWSNNEGWQILKYTESNHFVNHYDDSKQFQRTISMSYCLNDGYEGGEIEFPRFNLKIKPKANQAIFFPSNYVYNHIVHPVISGTRYAVVGWWE